MTAHQPLASLAKYGSRTMFHVNSAARAMLPRGSDGRLRIAIEPTKDGGIRIKPSLGPDAASRIVHTNSGQVAIPANLIPAEPPAFWTIRPGRAGTLIGTLQENA